MKRTVITVDGNGRLSIPSNVEDLWMSENELAVRCTFHAAWILLSRRKERMLT